MGKFLNNNLTKEAIELAYLYKRKEQLLTILKDTYQKVMIDWYKEWKEIETVR